MLQENGLGHDVQIIADSNDAEADATSKAYGGALGIRIGAPDANATSTPVVHAFIGSGSTIVAGGAVTVDATSASNGNGQVFDDYLVSYSPADGSDVPTDTGHNDGRLSRRTA